MGAKELIRGTRGPTPAPVPAALPLLYWGQGLGEGFYFCEGTKALAPKQPQLGGPARQGEGTAVSIYLTGPHSPSHAVDHGQGRLWGQKHYSLVPPRDNLRVSGALERAAWRGGIDPFIGKEIGAMFILQKATKKCFTWFVRQEEQGTSLGPFTPSLPE